jgi:hypothetical protein
LAVATNIFTAPAAAFAAIKERPSPWFPLLLLIAGYCLTSFLYLNAVDLPWLMDRQLAAGGGQLTDEQRARAVEAALRLSPTVYGVIGAVSSSLAILAILALLALYYTGVSFATAAGVKFKQWFALISWCTLPFLFGLLATIVNLVVGDMRFVPQEALNPLSFGNLLAIDTEGVPTVQRVLLSLDPTTVWSLVLTIFGYQALTQRSTLHAALVVLAPYLLIALVTAL